MSKETAAIDLSSTQTNQTMETSLDQFSNFLSAPVRKLDADEYTANDLDGVTESATGSGNLNFLMMQAGQTNEAMTNMNPFNLSGGGDNFHFGHPGFGGAGGALPTTHNEYDIAMDRGFENSGGADGLGQLTNTGNSNNTAGSL